MSLGGRCSGGSSSRQPPRKWSIIGKKIDGLEIEHQASSTGSAFKRLKQECGSEAGNKLAVRQLLDAGKSRASTGIAAKTPRVRAEILSPSPRAAFAAGANRCGSGAVRAVQVVECVPWPISRSFHFWKLIYAIISPLSLWRVGHRG